MLQPSISIITNIENDHLINYQDNFQNLENAFIEFAKKLPFDGLLIVCGDDPVIKKLIQKFSRPVVTYGFNKSNNYVISQYRSNNFKSSYLLSHDQKKLFTTNLNMLGPHNALNATAATILALEEGIDPDLIKKSLGKFLGIARRMQVLGEIKNNNISSILIDDYGHHPTELRNTIKSIRNSMPEKKLTMVFQPHRYSRTRDLYEEFLEAFKLVDELILLEVYSAGENKIKGCSSSDLVKSMKIISNTPTFLAKSYKELTYKIKSSIKEREGVLLMQGAGNISRISKKVFEKFNNGSG